MKLTKHAPKFFLVQPKLSPANAAAVIAFENFKDGGKMKSLFTVLLVIFCSIFVSAQLVTETNDKWQTLAPVGGEYSIEFPTTKDDYGNTVLNGNYYFIEDGDEALKELKVHNKTGKTVTVGKYKANKFEFQDADSLYQTILIIRTKNNNYAFRTYSQSLVNPDVERFFNSLKIFEKPVKKPTAQNKKVNKAVQKQTQKQNSTNKSNDKGTGVGGGIGSGSTVGNGRGSGRGDGDGISNDYGENNSNGNNETNTEKPIQAAKITKPITFISMPKPSYSDVARQRGIQGKVILRITFLANGQIGLITPVFKLPFGLTVSAIAVAKRITFKPAMKDGQPYSVTKQVEFNFSIY